MAPSVLVFTIDCLREAVQKEATTPFLESLPIRWTKCFSSGTWTLPAHASLFSGQSPIKHGCTRPGDSISGPQSNLMSTAEDEGYETAIFSENPTFSSYTGFDSHVDHSYDDIHRKLLPSSFSPHDSVDSVSVQSLLALAKTVFSTEEPSVNLINILYSAYLRYFDQTTMYPHHGERLFSFLEQYLLTNGDYPKLTIANVLEPHNPYIGTPPHASRSQTSEEVAALRAGRDNRTPLLTEECPPDPVKSEFGDWSNLWEAQRSVYEEYVAESDRLISDLFNEQPTILDDTFVVIVGDHGQLFGVDGMLGHHTSLHPHGINVPLGISPPTSWTASRRTIDDPVSLSGLGQTLIDLCTGEIGTTDGFVESIRRYSREIDDAVVTCADGPTWEISSLRCNDRYDEERVNELAVRKVALARDDRVDVYRSPWDTSDIFGESYDYTSDSREVLNREIANPPPEVQDWLEMRYTGSEERRTGPESQLEALGYV